MWLKYCFSRFAGLSPLFSLVALEAKMPTASSTAMSHTSRTEIYGDILKRVLPYLTKHEDRVQGPPWYRDRHYHNRTGYRANPMTPVRNCPCCTAIPNPSDPFGCELCCAAWKLSVVNKAFKKIVRTYGSELGAWWWVWSKEYRA